MTERLEELGLETRNVGHRRFNDIANNAYRNNTTRRLLARRADGSFKQLKDFPSLTGHELADSGHFLALRRGASATGDGPMVPLDVNRARPRNRSLTNGVNPVWGP